MSITRTYMGADGHSHIEALDLAAHAELTALMATKGVVFRRAEPGHFSDWHNAPRRQWVVTLSGEAELGFVDGSVFGAGQGYANLSGRFNREGDTTRVVGIQPRVAATIHLAD